MKNQLRTINIDSKVNFEFSLTALGRKNLIPYSTVWILLTQNKIEFTVNENQSTVTLKEIYPSRMDFYTQLINFDLKSL